jgi:hypothetical protein
MYVFNHHEEARQFPRSGSSGLLKNWFRGGVRSYLPAVLSAEMIYPLECNEGGSTDESETQAGFLTLILRIYLKFFHGLIKLSKSSLRSTAGNFRKVTYYSF